MQNSPSFFCKLQILKFRSAKSVQDERLVSGTQVALDTRNASRTIVRTDFIYTRELILNKGGNTDE